METNRPVVTIEHSREYNGRSGNDSQNFEIHCWIRIGETVWEPQIVVINQVFSKTWAIKWNGAEKTYDMVQLVNLVIRFMKEKHPDFELTGKFLADSTPPATFHCFRSQTLVRGKRKGERCGGRNYKVP
jgi:hypothetical protein